MMKHKFKSLIAFCALALYAPDFAQAAGGENISITTTLSPEQRKPYRWPNADEPEKALFPNYTFSFDVKVETTAMSKYKLADITPNPEFLKVEDAGVLWIDNGTVHSVTNTASHPVTLYIGIIAKWVLKDSAESGNGDGSAKTLDSNASAVIRLANSDVVWTIENPVGLILLPDYGEIPFDATVVDTNGFQLSNWTFNSFSIEDIERLDGDWDITDLGQFGSTRQGIVRSLHALSGKIQISYNDGNVETRKSEKIILTPTEIKVDQVGIAVAPNNADPTYRDAPKYEPIMKDLCAVWSGEDAKIEIKGIPENMLNKLPAGFIQWFGSSTGPKNDSLDYTFNWLFTGRRTVTLKIGNSTYEIVFDMPKVGAPINGGMNQKQAKKYIIQTYGYSAALEAWNITGTIIPIIAAQYPTSEPKGPFRDALRHCTFAAALSSKFGAAFAQVVTDAHERQGYEDGTKAYDSTMDLFNNSVGISLGETWANLPITSKPDIAAIAFYASAIHDAGGLYVWWQPVDYDSLEVAGTLRYSNNIRITNP